MIEEELKIITKAAEVHKLDAVYSLFSGGSDSLCSTWIASHHPLFKGVVHLNTGIGIPEVQRYVQETCEHFDWDLKIYRASEYVTAGGVSKPMIYDDLVRKFGFPGPVNHSIMYTRLKEYPLLQAYREIKKQFKKPAWSTGIRANESTRRAANFANAIENGGFDKHAHRVWINPILFWDKDKKHELISRENLPVNPVYQYLCKSGECLCGAFAKRGELLQLEIHYPVVYKRLNDLYEEVKHKFPWKWDEVPNQAFLKTRAREKQGQMKIDFSPTCYSCMNQENDIKDE